MYNDNHRETLRKLEEENGGGCRCFTRMDGATLWRYLDTCQSWGEIAEGAVEHFVCERADMREEWESADGYEDVLNAACKKLGFPSLV